MKIKKRMFLTLVLVFCFCFVPPVPISAATIPERMDGRGIIALNPTNEDNTGNAQNFSYSIELECTDWGEEIVSAIEVFCRNALSENITAEALRNAFEVKVSYAETDWAGNITGRKEENRIVESAEINEDRKSFVLNFATAKDDTADTNTFDQYSVKLISDLDGLQSGYVAMFNGETHSILDKWLKGEETENSYHYRLFVPEEAKTGARPLIVWLHGAGYSGKDNENHIVKDFVTNLGSDEIQSIFGGAYVLAPQITASIWDVIMGNATSADTYYDPNKIMATIENVIELYSIDADRVYIGGCSLGGLGTWHTIVENPDFFAAAFPVCPASYLTSKSNYFVNGEGKVDGPNTEDAAKLINLPIYVMSTEADSTIDVNVAVSSYNCLKNMNANVYLTIFDKVIYEGNEYDGHNSQVYALRNYPNSGIGGTILTEQYGSDTPEGNTGYATFMNWLAAQHKKLSHD